MKAPALLLAGSLLLSAAAATHQPPAQATSAAATPVLSVDSTLETFHDSSTNPCGVANRVNIDGPVRAFEDQNHLIHLITAIPTGSAYQWTGSVAAFTASPRTAVLDCTPVMVSYDESDPVTPDEIKLFDQKTFLEGLYFKSPTIYGYGHEDYYATRLDPIPSGCDDSTDPDDHGHACWYSAVALWKAQVSGSHVTFAKAGTPPNHIAIYPRVQYPGNENTPENGWVGYGAPSNLIRGRNAGTLDGYTYMFVYTSGGDDPTQQPLGVCLFRSNDPTDRTSWRGWNGDSANPQFDQVMGNPYEVSTNTGCKVVAPTMFKQPVRSVVYHKPSGYFIAFYRAADGVRYSTSTDLVNWNASRLLVAGDINVTNYQSVVDFDGGDFGDDNFDRLYDNGKAYLFVRHQLAGGHSSLVRQKLSVDNYPADAPSAG